MGDGIDPVEFGKLLSSVQTLTVQLSETSEQLRENGVGMRVLDARIVELESRYRIGKGVLFGVVLGAGFAFKGVIDTVKALFL